MNTRDTLPTTGSEEPMHSPARARGSKRALLCAGLLSGAVYAFVPAPVFRTEAIVGVGDGATPLRAAMVEAMARAAVSKPVISQAAASLVDANLMVPKPGVLDRLGVAARLDAATSREARLSGLLRTAVVANPGDAPGIVRITAALSDAAGAARVATAVAEALVSHHDGETAETRARQEAEAARRLDGLRADARAAHQTFAALGGTDLDPARTRAAAAAQTAAAQGRLDVVRAILASGTPPVSDRRDLPEHVAALQSAYLDLSQKLATARETYGDRHTIVISLTDGMKRAAATLTAEWRRLSKVAEVELAAARDREASLGKPETAGSAAKRQAIETARLSAVAADAVVARAERARHDAPFEEASVRLLAPAPVPSQASGLALPWRIALAALAGLVSLLGMRLWRTRAAAPPAARESVATVGRAEPSFFEDDETSTATSQTYAADRETASRETRTSRDLPPAATPRRAERAAMPAPDVSFLLRDPARRAAPIAPSASTRDVVAPRAARAEMDAAETGVAEMIDAMSDVLQALDHVVPTGDLPTILVTALREGAGTTPVAESLAAAAAAEGLRVLLVEPDGVRAALAARAEPDADPVLVDLFGTLRVALPVDAHDGLVHVVPALRGGAALAARLALAGDVPLVEDLAGDFDLVVIDGRDVAESAPLADLADAVIRVARHPSKRDDDRLVSSLGVPPAAFLGTIAASTFVPKTAVEQPRPAAPGRSAATAAVRAVHPASPRPASLPRRRVAAR